jgi:protein SCO1/2
MALLRLILLLAVVLVRPTDAADATAFATLQDTSGRQVTLDSFPGRWQLVYFGYTQCPEFCSTMLADIAQLLDELGPLADRLQPVFITIDPERDTPELLADYVRAIDPRILALTGSEDAIRAAARRFGVQFQTVANPRAAGDYTIDHSVFLSVVDPRGEPVARLTHDLGARRMADIFRLLIEGS